MTTSLPETRIFAERNSDVTPDADLDDPLVLMIASAVEDEPTSAIDTGPSDHSPLDEEMEEKYPDDDSAVQKTQQHWGGEELPMEGNSPVDEQPMQAEKKHDEPRRHIVARVRGEVRRSRKSSPLPQLRASEPAPRSSAREEVGMTTEMEQAHAFIMLYVETAGVNTRWRWGHDQRNALEAEASNHTPRIRVQTSTLVIMAKAYVASKTAQFNGAGRQ